MSARLRLLERLKADLIGPSYGASEHIEDRPSDRYLTGILFPQNLEMADEEDEILEEVQAGKVADSDSASNKNVSIFRAMRPATAGISFALTHTDGVPISISIAVSVGQYSKMKLGEAPEREMENKQILIQGEQPKIYSSEDDGAKIALMKSKKHKWHWVREHKVCTRIIKLERSIQDIDLGDPDDSDSEIVPGLALFIKTIKIDDKIAVTVQAINLNKHDNSSTRDEVEQQTFFQFEMNVAPVATTKFVPRPVLNIANDNDNDAKTSALIYRDAVEYATGHTWLGEIGAAVKIG